MLLLRKSGWFIGIAPLHGNIGEQIGGDILSLHKGKPLDSRLIASHLLHLLLGEQPGAASYKNVSSRSKASRLMGLRRYPMACI